MRKDKQFQRTQKYNRTQRTIEQQKLEIQSLDVWPITDLVCHLRNEFIDVVFSVETGRVIFELRSTLRIEEQEEEDTTGQDNVFVFAILEKK